MNYGELVPGSTPLLRLGGFDFALDVAVHQEQQRTSEFKWPDQERFGQRPALQFTGLGEDTITLPGVIYPEHRGSATAISDLRSMAAAGRPYLLLDGQGNIYGRWVITQVQETKGAFAAYGAARKIEFTLTLKHFDGEEVPALFG